ncbi:serine O-acetyltransferase [Pseudoalteromonas sp. SSM20]|uniref:serine O-acetyltransferase n=1 Tax=Pseudoalteromonas sp. SSM20 TaxID=3139394 RepID=UPI003BA92D2E
MSHVSSTEADWSREVPRRFWDPSRRLLKSIRKYQSLDKSRFTGKILSKYWVVSHRFWSIVTGAEISLNCQIGGGLLLPHPNGIVIHPNAKIGVNCLIFQQVTLAGAENGTAPVLEGHVDIGAGAKILGNVVLGQHSRVGANAVVTKNVKENATVVGIPAREL